ncbi:MAG: creatininase family protein [Lachnospiraceae bacterium]|nr:creatininase family protein [Lachnospiraceae bacterium]
MRLEYSSWAQVQEYFKENDMVVVPLGSVENHGSHMGLGTDFLVPTKIVELLQDRSDVLCLPAMPYGMADHHTDFSGTLTIGHDGLYLVMSRIAQQLRTMGAKRIVFLNGHGGNTPVLTRVGLDMEKQGVLCAIIDWWVLAGQLHAEWKGGHAGAQETSAMMYAAPQGIHMEYAKPFEPKNLTDELIYGGSNNVLCSGIPVQVPRQTVSFSEAGWFGPDDIQTATPEWGEQMLNEVADFVADFLRKFEKA